MKLYTEEQLKNSMNSMKTYIEKYNENVIDKIVENHIRALGGIELPSDEEIVKDSKYKSLAGIGWIEGAKWMRDKIGGV